MRDGRGRLHPLLATALRADPRHAGGITEASIDSIHHAAPLHDAGKVGKSWLAQAAMQAYHSPLYLNWDQSKNRDIILAQSWPPFTDLLVTRSEYDFAGLIARAEEPR